MSALDITENAAIINLRPVVEDISVDSTKLPITLNPAILDIGNPEVNP